MKQSKPMDSVPAQDWHFVELSRVAELLSFGHWLVDHDDLPHLKVVHELGKCAVKLLNSARCMPTGRLPVCLGPPFALKRSR
jgi:hypothetical protein